MFVYPPLQDFDAAANGDPGLTSAVPPAPCGTGFNFGQQTQAPVPGSRGSGKRRYCTVAPHGDVFFFFVVCFVWFVLYVYRVMFGEFPVYEIRYCFLGYALYARV